MLIPMRVGLAVVIGKPVASCAWRMKGMIFCVRPSTAVLSLLCRLPTTHFTASSLLAFASLEASGWVQYMY